MKINALSVGGFLLLVLLPGLANALGLGQIKFESALGQPLKAHISLLGASDKIAENLRVKLADDGVYQRMGIERNPLLKDIQFSVVKDDKGQYVIDVETPNNITEPFINFLVEVDWKAGRLLREYTVLLDPPTFLEESAPAVETPEAELPPSFTVTTPEETETIAPPPTTLAELPEEPEETTPEAEPAEEAPAPVEAQPAAAEEPEQPRFYHEVKSGEVLWRIAENMRPENVTVEQMMLALQKENPQAFYGSTVSQLKAGAVLRIDDPSVLTEISPDEAIAEIARQHQEWLAMSKARQAENAVAASTNQVELEGEETLVEKTGGQQLATRQEPRVELVTPVEEQKAEKIAQTNVALEAAKKKLNQLNIELTLANEAIEASKRENKDLLNRLAALEEQMSAMQSLVQLKDTELQRLQAEVSKATGKPVETIPQLTLDLEKKQIVEKPINQPETDKLEQVKDTLQQLMEDPVTIASSIFIAIFLALLVWVLMRKSNRRKLKTTDSEQSLDDLFPEDESAPRTLITEHAQEEEFEDIIGVDPLTKISFEDSRITRSTDELRDPLAEADAYLAYDKFDDAEFVLMEAINKEPDRQDLKLKLLSVYAQKKDLDAFDNQAEILYAAIGGDTDNPLWQQACELARKIGSRSPIFVNEEQAQAAQPSEK